MWCHYKSNVGSVYKDYPHTYTLIDAVSLSLSILKYLRSIKHPLLYVEVLGAL